MMGTGSRIKHYRQKMGWTLDDLTERCGVDDGTINALENRDSVRSKYFKVIAAAFGLTSDQLADETQDHTVYDAVGIRAAIVKSSNANQATVMSTSHAGDTWATARWPFRNVSPAQYHLLTPDERKHLEDGVLLIIKAREPPTKQDRPAPGTPAS